MYRTKVLLFGLTLGLTLIAMEPDAPARPLSARVSRASSRASERSAQLQKAGGDLRMFAATVSPDIPLVSPVLTKLKDTKPQRDPCEQIKLIYRARRAIENGSENALKEILNSGEIDFTPQKGEYTSASFSLLFYAATLRYPKLCKMLLDAGANPNASSIEHPEGNTVLSETICLSFFPRSPNGIRELCALLIEHGAVVTHRCIQMAELGGGGFF